MHKWFEKFIKGPETILLHNNHSKETSLYGTSALFCKSVPFSLDIPVTNITYIKTKFYKIIHLPECHIYLIYEF